VKWAAFFREVKERLEPFVLVPVYLPASTGVGDCVRSAASHDGDFFTYLHHSPDAGLDFRYKMYLNTSCMSSRLTRKESQTHTRERLIEAASEIFREHGFYRASAETIAAQAGYTRGALYANFAGKERLFLAVLDQEITKRYRILDTTAAAATLAKRYCKLLDEDPNWTLALLEFSIHAARHPDLAAELQTRNEQIRVVITDMIQSVSAGLSHESAKSRAKLVLATNTGVSLERALDEDAAGTAELTRAYAAALRPG
jgi:AcrR family transcriptional regulator